jgi:hypothetical protein
VTNESWGHTIPTSSWGTSRTDHESILDSLPEEFLSIIEAFLIKEESEQFDRRLRTILFKVRHIDIINVEGNMFGAFASKKTLSLLKEFGLNELLDLFGGGLSRECHVDNVNALRSLQSFESV